MAIFVFGAGTPLWVLFKGGEVMEGRVVGQKVTSKSEDYRGHPPGQFLMEGTNTLNLVSSSGSLSEIRSRACEMIFLYHWLDSNANSTRKISMFVLVGWS